MNTQNRQRSLQNIQGGFLTASERVKRLGFAYDRMRWNDGDSGRVGLVMDSAAPAPKKQPEASAPTAPHAAASASASGFDGDRVPAEAPPPPPAPPLPRFTWGSLARGEERLEGSGLFGATSPQVFSFFTVGVKVLPELFGISTQEAVNLVQCPRHMRGTVADALNLSAVMKQAEVIPVSSRLIYIPCQQFWDPDAEDRGYHLGFASANVLAFVMHAAFRGWLVKTIAAIARGYRLSAEDNAPLVAVFACNMGRHRSVSACLVVRHMLEAMMLPRLPSPDRHTSLPLWCLHGCGNCAGMQGANM